MSGVALHSPLPRPRNWSESNRWGAVRAISLAHRTSLSVHRIQVVSANPLVHRKENSYVEPTLYLITTQPSS
jgi:hypothetical protein